MILNAHIPDGFIYNELTLAQDRIAGKRWKCVLVLVIGIREYSGIGWGSDAQQAIDESVAEIERGTENIRCP